MTSTKKTTEAEMAEILVKGLESDGWDVYQEVKVDWNIIDIIALRYPVVWIIETKMRLSLDVLDQVYNHILRNVPANYYSVGVPLRFAHSSAFVNGICRNMGISIIGVPEIDNEYRIAPFQIDSRETTPVFHRPIKNAYSYWRERLHPEHKICAKAGEPGSAARWTPFRQTVKLLIQVVEWNPGIRLKDAVKLIDHHYGRSHQRAYSGLYSVLRNTNTIKSIKLEDGKLTLTDKFGTLCYGDLEHDYHYGQCSRCYGKEKNTNDTNNPNGGISTGDTRGNEPLAPESAQEVDQ